MSVAETATVTGTRRWFGGHRLFGVADTEEMTGGVVSTIVTVVEAWAWLPSSSVAVKWTVVTPSGKTAGASLVTVTLASQLSVAVGSGTVTGVPARFVC